MTAFILEAIGNCFRDWVTSFGGLTIDPRLPHVLGTDLEDASARVKDARPDSIHCVHSGFCPFYSD